VLEPGLIVYKVNNGYWFWGVLPRRSCARTCARSPAGSRPHWDLAAPGRREQWDAGDRSRHYPYPDPSREPSAQSGAA